VPPAYFGIFSYSIGHAALYIPEGHFPHRFGGATHNVAEWREATACVPKRSPPQEVGGATLGAVSRLIQETHDFMLHYPAIKNYDLFYLYPHHLQPNPLVFREFDRLQMEDIVGYKYVVESVCLILHNGGLVREVKNRSEFRFDVR
jgi:hypothetical protein